MYNVAVCDDDVNEAWEVYTIVDKYLSESDVDAQLNLYNSPEELMHDVKIQGRRYDLFLLDILMGQANGVTVAKELRALGIRSKLVFITSSPDFWREGYKVEACDYLLKPVDAVELCSVVGKLLKGPSMIRVKLVAGDSVLLSADGIYWAEAFDHRTQLHTDRGDFMISGTLGDLEKLLPDNKFFRCHRSYLVNLDRVTQTGRKELSLGGGKKVPISRGLSDKLQEAMLRNVMGRI